jgi:hypothetical protein
LDQNWTTMIFPHSFSPSTLSRRVAPPNLPPARLFFSPAATRMCHYSSQRRPSDRRAPPSPSPPRWRWRARVCRSSDRPSASPDRRHRRGRPRPTLAPFVGAHHPVSGTPAIVPPRHGTCFHRRTGLPPAAALSLWLTMNNSSPPPPPSPPPNQPETPNPGILIKMLTSRSWRRWMEVKKWCEEELQITKCEYIAFANFKKNHKGKDYSNAVQGDCDESKHIVTWRQQNPAASTFEVPILNCSRRRRRVPRRFNWRT